MQRTGGLRLGRLAWIGLLSGLLPGRLLALDWPTYQHDYQRSGLTQEILEFPLTQALGPPSQAARVRVDGSAQSGLLYFRSSITAEAAAGV